MLKKIGKILFILLYFSKLTFAQEISISASVSETEVEVGEQFTYSVTVSGNVANVPRPTLPQLPDFRVYSSGTSSSFQFVNGVISSSITYNYVLVPLKEGTFTIGASKIEYAGKVYQTQPIEIKVVPKGSKPKTETKTAPPTLEEQLFRQRESGELFVKAYVNKSVAYVNEPITLKYKLYFKNVAISQYALKEQPSFTGFWIEDVPPPKRRDRKIELLNGVQYYTVELETKILFPTSAGTHTIGKTVFEFLIEDLFSFFGRSVVRQTEPITVKVLPLPENNKPKNFKGDVGNFKIDASLSTKEIKQNEPFILKVSISGTGNIKTITEPEMPDLKDFKLYDSRSSVNIQKSENAVSGSKNFEYILIPLTAGELIIPEFKYSFFDITTKKYKTIKTSPIKIKVKSAPPSSTAQLQFAPSSEVKVIGSDIRFIKENIKIKNQSPLIDKINLIFAMFTIPLIFLGMSYAYYRYKIKLASDIKYARNLRAYKIAKKRIKEIENKLKNNKIKNIDADFEKLLTEYIADRLNIPASSIIIDEIKKILSKRNIPDEIVSKIVEIYHTINMIRYSPAKMDIKDYEELLKNNIEIINQFEELKL